MRHLSHLSPINKRLGLVGRFMATQRTKRQPIKTFDLGTVDIRVNKTPEKRNLTPENGYCHPSVGVKVEEHTEKTQHTFLDKMEAIAFGVQARFEENSSFSRRVTETTVVIARKLGIPEDEIERWSASRLARLIHETERLSAIKFLLERIQESFLDYRIDNKGHLRRTIRSQRTLRPKCNTQA